MLHITSAQVTSGHCLVLQFDDGTHGEVDLAAELTGPIFEELLDPEQFKQAYVGLPEKAPIACAAVDPSGFCR